MTYPLLKSEEDGFTLAEVLVSLVIAMLVVTAVMHSFGVTIGGRANVEAKAVSLQIAHSLLAQARRSAIQTGILDQGEADGFNWRVTAEPAKLPALTNIRRIYQAASKDQQNDQVRLDLFLVTATVKASTGLDTSLQAYIAQKSGISGR